MKFKNLLLLSSLIFGSVISEKVDYSYSTDDFKYNFYCLEDNKGLCKFLEEELYQAVNSISSIVDIQTPVNFEAIVDDLSKYRIDTKKETLTVLLNNEFKPINTKDSTKDNNIQSPYPNSDSLLKVITNEEKNDFIIVLNNFKSDKKYLDSIKNDFDSSIIMEIFDGLKVLNKVGYPYNTVTSSSKGKTVNIDYEMEGFLPKRKNLELMQAAADEMANKCKDLVNMEKLHTVIHWEDTLISKDKTIGRRIGRSVGNPKNRCHVTYKNKYERVVVVGDIHGDYDHLVKILRHAKLIDEENNWIGKKSILMQIGDLMDRGDDTFQVYELMIKIKEQAKKKGGVVYMLLGNHEIFALQGDHHFTSANDNDDFGGFEKREEAFGPNEPFGKLLREELNVAMVIDDTLYTHAGMTSNFAEQGVDKLNKYVHDLLKSTPSVEDLYQLYLQHNIKHPIYNETIFSDDGPLFYRGFANLPEAEACPEIEKTLKVTNTKRMVIGHTPQTYGKIRTKCDGKLILVDIGISRCIAGGYNGYLEILNNKKEIWARYLDSNN
ncbi:Metallo-dependent phosphatase [Anaeromyces robustus]|uniref:Metallo-dependent phosphatase n=1 Tax=Anaeromyces robustus TaxID=1754192 RepID=A0A1Y1X4X4_9FUNG|nr:Metallo-dependent phosphatase [Anaeromyces robustus]|eukprot:ORX80364.1 Metallo-dependent phosphatase [Anaeromyces robustus]